ncbi:uncharacterized protein ATC70_010125 [Mucor velutinosus]|uniref:CS domain-containing protein n=1 Tax=Mucor velutinosus TaxID=708070 RepID=A0AAN7DRC7_9FUNG|nr:hypothetical protein ATC70_010125 [Mucor velutinosus]
MNTKEEHIQELKRLKDLTTVPSVQKVLEDLITENRVMREPIRRSKAQIQTIYITTGFAWNQTPTSIIIYINFKDAGTLSTDNCSMNTTPRSLEFNVFNHNSAHHKFKINQLYSFIQPEKSSFKLKEHKIVISLTKKNLDSVWLDLRMKSTQKTYQELERYEKINGPKRNNINGNNNANYDTPFKEGSYCSHHLAQGEPS